jgi:hypothetical protein
VRPGMLHKRQHPRRSQYAPKWINVYKRQRRLTHIHQIIHTSTAL